MSNSKKRAAEDAPASKKAKKKKKKSSNPEDESLDTELGVNALFSRMDNQLLADYLAQKTSRFGSELSSIELADLTVTGQEAHQCDTKDLYAHTVPAGSITDTSSWQETRSLEKLPGFIEKFTEKPETLTKPPKKKGAPHTLIVAGAGLRAANITR